jgi:site-specific DNA-methyltransferase (adenine-specific)
MRPYYEDDAVTIYHGDCREILPTLGPVDLVLTDPPYGVGKAEWDNASWDWLPMAARASQVMGIMPGIANLLTLPFEVEGLFYRWMLSVRIINNTTRGVMGFGNWIACAVYSREGVSVYDQAQDATEVSINGQMPDHPSPKPYDAMRWLVSRLPGEVVLDPFMGSGTTLRAAKDLGRKAIGIEIEERYCEIAAQRMSQSVLAFDAI